MKKILFVLLFTFSSACLFAQSNDCKNFRNGVFKTVFNGQTAVVKRAGSSQVEFLVAKKDTAYFTVKWVNDCTYTLTPKAIDFAKYPRAPKNIVLTVTIIKTTKNSYTQVTKSNLNNNSITSEMIKVADR